MAKKKGVVNGVAEEDVVVEKMEEVSKIIKNPEIYERVVKRRASEILINILLNFDEDKVKQLTPKTISAMLPILMELAYSFKAPNLDIEEGSLEEKKNKLKELIGNIKRNYPEIVEIFKEVKDGRQ